MISNLELWHEELLESSDLPQDGDTEITPEEVEARFKRYVELMEFVTGQEPQGVFQAIIDSIRVPEDLGAYEAVHNALWRFPPASFAEYMIAALPIFIVRMAPHDQVARFLCPLLGHGRETYLPVFNEELGRAAPQAQAAILAFVRDSEDWFTDPADIRPGR